MELIDIPELKLFGGRVRYVDIIPRGKFHKNSVKHVTERRNWVRYIRITLNYGGAHYVEK
jgi:hypothetical protein